MAADKVRAVTFSSEFAVLRKAERGPQTIWWTSSIPELTEIIILHDDIIRERAIAAGVSIEEFIADPDVVVFHVWWDR
jgi:hypothetical protein